MARKDTLGNFMSLDDFDKTFLLEIINKNLKTSYHIGLFPFIARSDAVTALNMESDYIALNEGCDNPTVDKLLAVLDFNPWVDITTMSDMFRKELNTLTGETRETTERMGF